MNQEETKALFEQADANMAALNQAIQNAVKETAALKAALDQAIKHGKISLPSAIDRQCLRISQDHVMFDDASNDTTEEDAHYAPELAAYLRTNPQA